MPVTRINHFEAKPGRGLDLRRFLESVTEIVRRAPGNLSCQLLESVEQPERFAILEVWDSIDAHQAAAAAIPPAQ